MSFNVVWWLLFFATFDAVIQCPDERNYIVFIWLLLRWSSHINMTHQMNHMLIGTTKPSSVNDLHHFIRPTKIPRNDPMIGSQTLLVARWAWRIYAAKKYQKENEKAKFGRKCVLISGMANGFPIQKLEGINRKLEIKKKFRCFCLGWKCFSFAGEHPSNMK